MTILLNQIYDRMDEPNRRGLANAVSTTIRDGVLREGDRVPPIRTVAHELGLAPATVSAAWNLLIRAGTIRTDGRRGTTVAPLVGGPARYRRALGPSDIAQDAALDLSSGLPDPALLPDLSPAMLRLARGMRQYGYLDDPVLPELRELMESDLPYVPNRLTVVDGAMDALQLVALQTLRFGDIVLVEHPSFPPLIDLLDSLGVKIVGIAVDEEGVIPEALAENTRSAAALIIQPRAHNPLGVSMTARRAKRIGELLRPTTALVIEDDSSGPISLTPPISIGSTLPERTIHIRSYSKSHGPDLRIAVLAGPASIIDPLVERRHLGQGWTSRLLQAVLHFQLTHVAANRQVDRAREQYARRRKALVDALAVEGIAVAGRDGLNLWLPVQDQTSALLSLSRAGVVAAAGDAFSTALNPRPHLRVTTAALADGYSELAGVLAAASRVGSVTGPR